MPIYEYVCLTCDSSLSIWFRSFTEAATEVPVCTTCGSHELKRKMSTYAVVRSGGQTGKRHSAPVGSAHAEDPQSLARVMREASTGRDMGSDFNEVASRLEKGEGSQAVEASLRHRVGERMQPH
jgi:putative FmdB family regulatory protein